MSADSAERIVLAIDGGNIKTDVALVAGRRSPAVAGPRRRQLASHSRLPSVRRTPLRPRRQCPCGGSGPRRTGGVRRCHRIISRPPGATGPTLEPIADIARVLLAGADLPEEVVELQTAFGALGWAPQLVVENDTLALLRTGTDRGWGVAVVCGGGINAVGIAPDGRAARFPALGPITGDWGGGYDVGVAGLGAAARSADGRGPRSTLEEAVPEHFGLSTPLEVARAFHFKEISLEALAQLSPVVYEHAEVDAAAREILERVADEVAALARAALTRLELRDAGAEVVLGGGLMRAAPPWMIERISELLSATSTSATLVVAQEGPIVGAAILGLDALAASPDAIVRARAELQQAIGELGQQLVS